MFWWKIWKSLKHLKNLFLLYANIRQILQTYSADGDFDNHYISVKESDPESEKISKGGKPSKIKLCKMQNVWIFVIVSLLLEWKV